jgi:hypothetical protein
MISQENLIEKETIIFKDLSDILGPNVHEQSFVFKGFIFGICTKGYIKLKINYNTHHICQNGIFIIIPQHIIHIKECSSDFEMKVQDKFDASVGMDLVSGYIWRGQDLGNVSIQPEVSLAYKGFSLTGWGTVGFDKDDIKEFDLTLGYEVKGFSCSVTDYWTNGGPGYFHYGAHNTSHTFEAQIGYDFGFLSVDCLQLSQQNTQ